ncbi:MAG: JAB domain-containing protein [Eubacteriales bacterium]
MVNLHENHRARLRGRFISDCHALGGDVFDGWEEHNIAELLLFYAVARRDVNEDAHLLCSRFGSLNAALSAGENELPPAVYRLFTAINALLPYALDSASGFADAQSAARSALRDLHDGEAEVLFFTSALSALGRAALPVSDEENTACAGSAPLRQIITRELIVTGAECVMTVRRGENPPDSAELETLRAPYEICRCLGRSYLGTFSLSGEDTSGDMADAVTHITERDRQLLLALMSIVSRGGETLCDTLFAHFHSLRAVLRADIRELSGVVGERAAVLAAMPRAISRRMAKCGVRASAHVSRAQTLRAAGDGFVRLYAGAEGELCRVCAISDGCLPRDFDICGGGGFSSARLDMNMLARYACAHSGCEIIAAHNHPASERELSRRDIDAAELLRADMRIMGLKLAACMMICGSSYTFF